MSKYRSALQFIDSVSNEPLPAEFLGFLGQLGVELNDQQRSHLRMRATVLQDWWFCWVEGGGLVRIIADQPSLMSAEWDLLLYSARGSSHSLTPAPIVPSAGQFLLSRPGYAGDIVSEGRFGYLCVFIPSRYLADVNRDHLPYGRPTSAHRGPGAIAGASLRALVASAMDGESSDSCSVLLPDVARLLFSALQQISVSDGSPASPITKLARARQFKRVLDYIQTHHSDPDLSVEGVAGVIGLSERSIYRGFAQIGESFGAYLQRLRLDNAATLLSSGMSLAVSEVAYDCGFSSPSSFCRMFRRTYGVSPGVFGSRPSLAARV